MTEARFNKYGQALLEVCEGFYLRRQQHLTRLAEKALKERESNVDFSMSAASTSGAGSRSNWSSSTK